MKRLLWSAIVVGVCCTFVVPRNANADDRLKPFSLAHLTPAKNVVLLCPRSETYVNGGAIMVSVGAAAPADLSTNNTKAIFQNVTTKEQAKELCELLVWGALVESDQAFNRVLDLYRDRGFLSANASTAGNSATAGLPGQEQKKRFDQIAEERADGFAVSFTAFVLHRGMGASAGVERLQFRVSRDATVRTVASDVYLSGPCLNWQTMELTPQEEKEDEARYSKIRQLIDRVYGLCPGPLPPSRKNATPGLAQP